MFHNHYHPCFSARPDGHVSLQSCNRHHRFVHVCRQYQRTDKGIVPLPEPAMMLCSPLCVSCTHTHPLPCMFLLSFSFGVSFLSLWHMPLFSVQGLLVLTTANIVTVITTVSMSAVCTNGQIKVKLLLPPPPPSKRCAVNGINGSPPINCKYFFLMRVEVFFHKVCHNYSRAKIRHTCFVLIKFQMLLNSMGNIGKLGKKYYPPLPLAGLAKIRLFLEKSADF